jgi:hypothetical protein
MTMSKFTSFLKATAVTAVCAFTALLPVTGASAITPGSIKYEGAETSGVNFPAFNIFHDVPSVGNEADFIRVKLDGEANSQLRNSVDINCKTGDRFDVWFYLHNGAKPSLNDNGDGPGVAKDVVAGVTLPNGEASSFSVRGNVSASNAQAISDTATINCGTKTFKLKYVDNSAQAFLDLPNKVVPLPAAFANGGTPIGTNELNGEVWGCWEQRIWMGLKVEVIEVEEEEEPVYRCDSLTVTPLGERKYKFAVKATANNGATITGYTFDFGDGNTLDRNPSEKEVVYTYDEDDEYDTSVTVRFDVNGNAAGGEKTDICEESIEVTSEEEPAKPEKLPDTGPADTIGLFLTVSAIGTLAHNWVTRRRLF